MVQQLNLEIMHVSEVKIHIFFSLFMIIYSKLMHFSELLLKS